MLFQPLQISKTILELETVYQLNSTCSCLLDLMALQKKQSKPENTFWWYGMVNHISA